MTIAEQLKQEGRQEGAVMGQIQSCQELLNLPVSAVEELARQSIEDLESLLGRLKAQLRSRVRN
jgi:predicted transposase YdaD